MEPEKTNLLTSVFYSFDPKFYPRIFQQPLLSGLLYMWVVLASVFVIIFFLAWPGIVRQFTDISVQTFTERLPDFYIEDGKAVYTGEQPYLRTEEETIKNKQYHFLTMIDTSETEIDLDEKYEEAIVVLHDRILLKFFGIERPLYQQFVGIKQKMAGKNFISDLFEEMVNRRKIPRLIDTVLHSILVFTLLVFLFAGIIYLVIKIRIRSFRFLWIFNIVCYAATPFLLAQLPLSAIKSQTIQQAVFLLAVFLSASLVYAGFRAVRQYLAPQEP